MKKVLVIVFALLAVNASFAVNYRVDLHDEWGGGMGGCYLTVSVNGITVLEPFSLGEGLGPQSYYFSVEDGDDVFVDFYEGSDPYTYSYYIYNELGEEIANSGLPGDIPGDVTLIAEVPYYDQGTLDGVVTDITTGLTIPMADVRISNSNFDYMISTDTAGKYTMEVITSMGAFDISCSASGLTSEPVNVIAIANETVTNNFQLDIKIGDKVENPIWISGNSFTHDDNTSDYRDDYEIGIANWWSYIFDAPDVVYAFTIEEYKTLNVSLNFASWETQVVLFEAGDVPQTLNHIASGDTELSNVSLGPGTYYIVVDGKIIEEGVTEAEGTYTLFFNLSEYMDPAYDEDFEGGTLPVGWKVVDANGDSFSWEMYAGIESFDNPFSGDYVARFKTFVGWPIGVITGVDEWLIPRALMPTAENSSVRFRYRAASAAWTEVFQVRLSTTGTDIEDFTELLEETTVSYDNDWHISENDLSDYAGQQVYIAVVCLSSLEEGFMLDVDAFELPYYVPGKDLVLKSINVNYTPILGENNIYKVHVKNFGMPTDDYVVKLMNTNGTVLATATGIEIPTNAEQIINIEWNTSEIEETELYAVVEIDGDENTDNNESIAYTVFPQFEDQVVWPVGNENNMLERYGTEMPLSTVRPYSISKTIYPAYDMPGPGTINTLVYQYYVKDEVLDVPVTIYMGEIEKSNLTGETILADDLDIVFIGELDFIVKDDQLVIPLSFPYDYQGGNLVVMFHKDSSEEFNYFSWFITSPCRFSTVRSQSEDSDVAMDPNDPNQIFWNVADFPNTKFVMLLDYTVDIEEIEARENSSSMISYPNPFSSSTTIKYEQQSDSHINVSIYNISGQLISVLVNSYQSEGTHTIEWNGVNQAGMNVPDGIYYAE